MQISGLYSGYSDPTTLEKLLETTSSTSTSQTDKSTSTSATTQPSTETIRTIVNKYDLKNMTPQQFSEMLQELHDAGALTDQQLQELSTIRTDLDLQGVDSDEPIDLLEYYSTRLEDLQKKLQDAYDGSSEQSPQPESLQTVTRWLAWLQKIATVQSSPEALTVDTLA